MALTKRAEGEEEILDVVDEHDVVVRQATRAEIYANNLPFRAINVLIENDKGELWIPRRVASKKLFPLALDMSVAGHVGAGETYEYALRRELEEELFLNLDDVDWSYLGYLSPFKDGSVAFVKAYTIRMNDVPSYNKNDYCEAYWLTPQEVMNRIEQGEKTKSDLPVLLKTFYLHR